MVTLEAYHNYKRMVELHVGERCRDEQGEFGPPAPRV